jgi:acyl-CoA dehydrogenase
MTTGPLLILALLVAIALLYLGRGYWAWVLALALLLAGWGLQGIDAHFSFALDILIVSAAAVLFGFRPLRRHVISSHLMRRVAKVLPRLGDTERIALEAGTVWWDGELFSGRPRWRRLLDFKSQPLTKEEQDFLDGPVEELCRLLNEWEIIQARELPPEVWDFLCKHRFFGMIIPKEHGGLGFSALAHSAVVTKISSRSLTASVTVMVPNSLGPAELLLHYGTEEQKRHYLPRLATGEEIPCFALTGPEAGSDAASFVASVCSAYVSIGASVTSRWHRSPPSLGSPSGFTIPSIYSATLRTSVSPVR